MTLQYDLPELFALGVLYGTAVVLAYLVYRVRRDLFDPRVFFPLFYAYVCSGACLFKIFCSGEYHPGLKVDLLIPVLFSCSTAIVGFVVGGTFGMRKTGRLPQTRRVTYPVKTLKQRLSNRIVRDIAVLGAAVTVAGYAFFSYLLQSNAPVGEHVGKAYHLANADEGTLRLFYFFAAASTATLTLAVITDAYVSRKAFSPAIASLLAFAFAVCTYSGERDVLLVAGVWCISNWPKLSRFSITVVVILVVGWMGLSPVLRTSGLGFGSQLSAIEKVRGEDWFYSVTHFAPNVHVFTNVATEVPAVDEHWNGKSLVGAFASFLPGEFALKDETPSRWFHEVYDMQKVAGYAFSQDAEAYLNFGWFGPPLWFAVWGYLLSVGYRRAIRPNAQLWDVFIWWYGVAVSVFGVRSDSRGILKMFILGAIASKLLCLLADHWAENRSRGLGGVQTRQESSLVKGRRMRRI